jgi:CheY-like chemotaxis protein
VRLGQLNQKRHAVFRDDCPGGLVTRAWILVGHVSGHHRVSVLVAAYDRWSRLCVSGVLRAGGLSVHEASNGMSALRLARDVRPQVIILGPELPEIAPADLIGLLRSDPRTRDAAVVQLAPDTDAGVGVDANSRLPHRPIELFNSVLEALAARHIEPSAPAAARPRRALASTPRLAAVG